MQYILIHQDEFFPSIAHLRTSDQTFIKTICNVDTEDPTNEVALEYNHEFYIDKTGTKYIGGIKIFEEQFLGVARALLGIDNEYCDFGTIIIGGVISNNGKQIEYKFKDIPSCNVANHIIASKFIYENTKSALTKLYDSYIECKRHNPDLLSDSNVSYAHCDKWYIMAAILNNNADLLDRIFAEGARAYGPTENDSNIYLGLAVLGGNKEVFETLLKYQVYTNFEDLEIRYNLLSSRKTSFIIWYRRKYKKLTGHDIPFWYTLFHLKSISELIKFMVTFPWIP